VGQQTHVPRKWILELKDRLVGVDLGIRKDLVIVPRSCAPHAKCRKTRFPVGRRPRGHVLRHQPIDRLARIELILFGPFRELWVFEGRGECLAVGEREREPQRV
jgi:hypothetical protein